MPTQLATSKNMKASAFSCAESGVAETLISDNRRRREPGGTSNAYGIRVEGVDDVLLRLAKCCRPVPGDPIVGYITQGRGVSIHRQDCASVLQLAGREPERIIQVSWGPVPVQTYPVDIVIKAYDRSGLLRDVSRTATVTAMEDTTLPPAVLARLSGFSPFEDCSPFRDLRPWMWIPTTPRQRSTACVRCTGRPSTNAIGA